MKKAKKQFQDSIEAGATMDLTTAAILGDDEQVRRILAAGADLDAGKPEWRETPLSWAATKGHTSTVRLLLEAGADVDADDVHGDNPLIHALQEGYIKTVQILLAAGANVNYRSHRHGSVRAANPLVGYRK